MIEGKRNFKKEIKNKEKEIYFLKNGQKCMLLDGSLEKIEGNKRIYQVLDSFNKVISTVTEIFQDDKWRSFDFELTKEKRIKKETYFDLSEGEEESDFIKLSKVEKEKYFLEAIHQFLVDKIGKEFIEVGFSNSDLDYLLEALDKLPKSDKELFLSLPYDLRIKKYKEYFEELEKGRDSKDIIDELISFVCDRKEKYHIGYHTSADRIPLDFKTGEWNVIGTEKDHRNDDLLMAYYSLNFRDLYNGGKIKKYLYLVRADLTRHYRDNNLAWGRSYTLPIIEEINMDDVRRKLYFKKSEK